MSGTRSGGSTMSGARGEGGYNDPADVLVIFGISGNLARVMTFRSLYRLELSGLLDCPIVGVAVDEWNDDDLRSHAREAVEGTGEAVDDGIFARLAARLTYVAGDFTQSSTYGAVRAAIGDARRPVFYLEIPPFLFGTVVGGLGAAGLTREARVVVEKPFGDDRASAHALAEELHEVLDEAQILRIDHFLGKMGLTDLLFLRFANTMLEPVWNRNYLSCVQVTLSESFGVEDRGHFYDPVGALRDVVVNHMLQVVAAAAMEAPAGGDPKTLKDAQLALFRAVNDADPSLYVRGQYEGYLETEGVPEDSSTETYAALRLDIDNWRWSGVPFFIRTGKHLAVTQTELRLVFKPPPRLGFALHGARPEPNQLAVRLDPMRGVQLVMDATRPGAPGAETFAMDTDFAAEGIEATPYEVLLHAALIGNTTRFTRQDGVEEQWRIMQPLLDAPPPVHSYSVGSMGPVEADALLRDFGGWRGPWVP